MSYDPNESKWVPIISHAVFAVAIIATAAGGVAALAAFVLAAKWLMFVVAG